MDALVVERMRAAMLRCAEQKAIAKGEHSWFSTLRSWRREAVAQALSLRSIRAARRVQAAMNQREA